MSTPSSAPIVPPKPNKSNNSNIHNNNDYDNNNTIYHGKQQNGNGIDSEFSVSQNSLAQPPEEEQVVMTPKGKTANSTILLIERKLIEKLNERVHVAGGDHRGIIINKDTVKDQKSQKTAPHISLEFRVFLVSANTGQHSQESRTLRFWFRTWFTDGEQQAHIAQDFFTKLVTPTDFPRDYVGFIKKIMKLLQKGYNEIQALEVELKILEQVSAPPSRPLSLEETQFEVVPLTAEKVLELVEHAYPNPITPEDLAKDNGWSEDEVMQILITLQNRGIIKSLAFNSFTRIHHEDTEIKVVKQMPTIASNKQPTIAIITTQYCEKLAVDAMLENKETFVRYTTVGTSPEKNINGLERRNRKVRQRFGESNVYTLGNIGAHRIVSTKLPSVGSTREAMTAAGNTTTRLLGTFQKVDFVFIVGVAGGIPHYTDYRRHVRLGDVVLADIDQNQFVLSSNGIETTKKPYVYVYNSGENIKTYLPVNKSLQDIAKYLHSDAKKPWQTYLNEGIKHLQGKTDTDFTRPATNTDKLYMNIGNRDVIEVQHPTPQDAVDGDYVPATRLHLGPVGSGRDFIRSDRLRTEFAKKYNLLATDLEMSSVIESIIGNCRESFILIKGITDYKDGTSTKKWHNYSSLAAAAVMKSIICAMDAPTNV